MRLLTTLLLATAVCLSAIKQASAGSTQQNSEANAEINLQEEIPKWLAQGEHQDIPWKVHVDKPVLTFQQRDIVMASADIDGKKLQAQSERRDLIFLIKVADERGQWLPGENFVTSQIEKRLADELHMASEVLLRPGKYTIAIILYDHVQRQHNVNLTSVEVPAVKNDPLPQVLQNMPAAEFVRGGVEGADVFGGGTAYITLNNRTPIQVDLLINLSAREHRQRFDYDPIRPPPMFRKRISDKTYVSRLLQTASVLGALSVDRGCVRVSAFDSFKQRVILPPTVAKDVDWQAIHDQELGPVKETISLDALKNRHDVPKFFAAQFTRAVDHGCASSAGENPLHIAVVLSHGMEFPDGSQKVRLENCNCKVFYMKQSDVFVGFDDLKGELSPLAPKILEFHSPEQFREKLAELIQDIHTIAQ